MLMKEIESITAEGISSKFGTKRERDFFGRNLEVREAKKD